MPDHHMWSADVAALSVDGWQPNEDAVVMQSQRLVTNVPPDTVEQCRPGIGASSYTVCTWDDQARQANEGWRVVAASDHGQPSSCHWPLGLPHLTLWLATAGEPALPTDSCLASAGVAAGPYLYVTIIMPVIIMPVKGLSLLLHKTTATYPINQLVQQPQNFDPISHQYTIITNP